jgi:hypothetical protein
MGPLYSTFRLASVVVVALLASLAPDRITWVSLAWSLAFSHYLVGLWYSRTQFLPLLRHPTTVVSLGVLMTMGMGLYFTGWPLLYYFGVHHALNEVYMLNRITHAQHSRALALFRGAGWLLHLVLYAAMLRKQRDLAFLNTQVLWGTLLVVYLLYGASFLGVRAKLSPQERIDNSLFECLGIGFVIASVWIDFTALHIACYHFAFWVFYPTASFIRMGRGLIPYLGLTVGTLAGFILLSPLALLGPHLSLASYRTAFHFFSYFHITLSFALSDANPSWLRQVFSSTTHEGNPPNSQSRTRINTALA